MRPAFLLAAAFAISLTSSGCGDEAGKVRDTVRAAIAAATHGDPHKACTYVTTAGRARMVQAFSRMFNTATGRSGPVLRSCEAVIEHERVADRSNFERVGKGNVSDARVRGTNASVVVTDSHGGIGHLTLRKLNGAWRIDDSDALPKGS